MQSAPTPTEQTLRLARPVLLTGLGRAACPPAQWVLAEVGGPVAGLEVVCVTASGEEPPQQSDEIATL
ncbi:MAG: hypothetical protein HY689_08825, partial [Chloroflexi bacterium]|nr:hypothetical protein [Chloroflexota bacterium]